MKMKKLLSLFTFAVAAAFAPSAAEAAGSGDIADIRVMDMTGKRFGERSAASGELCSPDNPVVAGEEICIRVRMIVRNARAASKGEAPQTWSFQPGPDWTSTLDQPKLGLRIGEKNVWATYSETGAEWWQFSGELQYDDAGNGPQDTYRYFTDFYFKYTVQPGDMGLPVKLLNTELQPADESRESNVYAFGGVNCLGQKFYLSNDAVGDANLFRVDPTSVEVDYPPPYASTYPLADYNLAKECLYVKTIDFDKVNAEGATWQEGDVWRKVFPGLSEPVVTAPAVAIQGGSKAPSDLAVYVWCEDENVAYPVGDEISSILGSDGVTRKVLTVHIGKDASGATFALEGKTGAAVDSETWVCMSPTKSVTYNPAGTPTTAYVRRRVQITKAPQPTIQMRFENGETVHPAVTADADYQTAKMQLVFRVVPAATETVTVNLSATVNGGSSLTALYRSNILRIPDAGFDIDGTNTTVTIEPGETVTRNVFVLGASEETEGGINFKLSKKSGPADVIAETSSHTVTIERGGEEFNAITASNPTEKTEVAVVKGETKTFKVKFSDTYKNYTKSQSGYTGYTFYLEDVDSGDVIAQKDSVKVGSGGWFSFDAKIELNPGMYSVELYAKSPDEVTTTTRIPYGLKVSDSKKVVVTPANGQYVIGEGEQMPLKLSLNATHKGEINRYIFLEAADPAQASLFSTTLTNTGAYVDKDYMEVSVPQNVKFLDGDKTITLNAFLANSQTDPTDRTASHTPGTITVTVTNKPPVLQSLNIAGNPLTVANDNGKVMENTVPMGIEKVFKLVTVNDVEADLKSLDVLWTIDGTEYEVLGTTVAGCAVKHVFGAKTAAGSKGQLVEVKIRDKDMGGSYPAEPNFRCWVKVTAKPNISITTSAIGGVINETDANIAMVSVALSEPASTVLQVMLKVQQPKTGVFKLRETEGSVQFVESAGGYDYYRLTFSSGAEKLILISEMDGTNDTLAGIDLSAYVDSPAEMRSYYDAGQLVPAVRVQNVPPEIIRPTANEEAYTNMNASANTPYSIFYGAKDVKADFAVGIDVSINVDGKTVLTDKLYDTNVKEHRVQFDAPGSHVVEVTFTDKDQMTSRATMNFFVSQSKVLHLRAHGPAGAMGSSGGYSSKYQAAKGLGAGRVYAGDNGPQKVANFVHVYSFGMLQSSTVAYAFGYKADETLFDNGSLQPGPDQAIDKNGNWTNGTPISDYYNYALDNYTLSSTHRGAKGLDSFVYGWACNNSVASKDSESGTEEFVLNFGATGSQSIPLPDAEDNGDDNGQLKALPIQYWEAIFSAELLKSDNCGDMNGDGIPDLFVQLYKFDVLDDAGQLTGDDLRDLNYNNDESGTPYCAEGDYLPTIERSAYSTLIPGLPETWATIGNEFTPVLKIRGFPEEYLVNDSISHPSALNDAAEIVGQSSIQSDRVYTNPQSDPDSTLSYVEWLAWSEYKAANPAATEKSWSPERPTDPTKADTDRDGMTDGYEYWVWYRAHVGWIENFGTPYEVHKRLSGRRYDPRNPGEGVRISPDEVARAFDPRSSAGSLTRDTDNDGLPDVLEFMIGTKPYDFDSDGDGLPDGWELMIAGYDPTTAQSSADAIVDTARNYDGDAMAISSYQLEQVQVPVATEIEHAKRWTFAVNRFGGDSDGVQWYATAEDPSSFLEEDTPVTDWYLISVNGIEYCVETEPAVVGDRLAADTKAYSIAGFTPPAPDEPEPEPSELTGFGILTGEDVGEPARGYPVLLPSGTVIDGPAEPQTTPLKVWKIKAGGIEKTQANACWIYGKGSANALLGEVAESAAEYGCLAIARNLAVDGGAVVAAFPQDTRDVAFLHYLCYQEFGFDPRTAWNPNTPLHKRWSTTIDGEALADTYPMRQGGYAGVASRTRAFTAYDEFLVCSFFVNNLTDGVNGGKVNYITTVIDPTAPDWAKAWSALTTNPQGPGEPDLIAGENYWGRNSDQGADTDMDGVPDGWELYVMSGPKDSETGLYLFAPPYDGFQATCGQKPMSKSYFSPFVAESSNNETASPFTTGTTGEAIPLTELRKYAGTDSCSYYSVAAEEGGVAFSTTIVRPAADANWLNKFFPCDPWSSDTDGDGISDGVEGRTGAGGFIYGTPFDNGSLTSIPGGGLNPLASDTDRDGLPDPWELQFKGHNDSLYTGDLADYAKDSSGAAQGNALQGLTDGMDGTVADAHNYPLDTSGNVVTYTVAGGFAQVVDRDYDHDGLDNWQEYLTGTMRCWRYDDPVTPLNGIPASTYYKPDDEGNLVFDAKQAAKDLGFGDDDAAVGEFWYKTLVDSSSPLFNPHLVTGTCAGSMYFSRISKVWDLAYYDAQLTMGALSGAYYWFYNRIDDTMLGNAWQARWKDALEIDKYDAAPGKYASCSPIDPDSDHDGMDDYYELFHGMNPLLGAEGVKGSWSSIDGGGGIHDGGPIDLVYDSLTSLSGKEPQAWGAGDDASNYKNFWQRLWAKRAASAASDEDDKYVGPLPRGTGYDFVFYPWLGGLATADADGDGTRNQEEAIMPLVSPTAAWHHTDPTALWMTDSSYSNSLVRTSYRLPIRSEKISVEGDGFAYNGDTFLFSQFDGFLGGVFIPFNPDRWGIGSSQEDMNFIASFEENEGFDTDHDGLADSDELGGKYRGMTDPLDADSPRRRQAMYFQGKDRPSVLQTMPFVSEKHPNAGKGNAYPDDMSFLQFTVECWVKADGTDDATILERVMWTSESNPADSEFVRCNFRLAVKGGKWLAKFDPNDTTKGSVTALSSIDASTDWTHLAATYDGATLRLYVNGVQQGFRQSGLQPAYGSASVTVDGVAGWHADPSLSYWRDSEYKLHAIVIGASVKTCKEGGDKARKALDVTKGAGFDAYTGFFKGYIDEVRIWDGARTSTEILNDKGVRYTAEMAAANREAFFNEWSQAPDTGLYRGRYAKDGSGNPYALPCELRFHWAFDSVFGAGSEEAIAKVPAGFDYQGEDEANTGARALLSRPEGYEIAWWKKVLDGYGSVYDGATNWVTWIPNTVTHLPRFDGTTLDSRYWSDDFAGVEPGSYRFARTAEPVSLWTQYALKSGGYTSTGSRNFFVTTCDLENGTTFGKIYDFTGRHLNQSGDDLLPLGGAYVKHIDEMWDTQGPSSNWEVTGGDADGDGLPDWWEKWANETYRDDAVTGEGEIEWETVVIWPDQKGVHMTAGEAYIRDLARGYHPDADGNLVDDDSEGNFRQKADLDGNGIPDWWEELFGITGEDSLADTDNDGLPNYVEYLLSEVFDFNVMFSPIDAHSVDPYVSDYFFKVGDLYVGEIFTDHDLVDDAWEDLYPNEFSSRLVWDAFKDYDSDGWSNRAEVRYAKQSMPTQADKQTHYSATDGLVADYPIPTLELTLNYNEALAETVRTAPIVVEVKRNASKTSAPDASFVIAGVSDTQAGSGSSSSQTSEKTVVSYTRTLGKWSNRHAIGTLTPGYINKDSLALEFCFDPDAVTYSWNVQEYKLVSAEGTYEPSWTTKRGSRAEYESDCRKYGDWNVELLSRDSGYRELANAELRTVEGTSKATWSFSRSNIEFGTLDLTTGAFDIDLGAFANWYVTDASNATDVVSMEDQTYRIVYSVNSAVDLPRKLYLGEATSGYVKEGLNQVVAFFDLNGDGAYTAGEPYGIANDVNVSWKGTSATIELNEFSPVTPRFSLWGGSSNSGSSGGSAGGGSSKTADRPRTISEVYQEIKDELVALRLPNQNYLEEVSRLNWMTANVIEETTPAANENIRLRVVRWLVNGRPVWRLGVRPRVIVDKQVVYRPGTAFTEADVLKDGELDIDWSYLDDEVVNTIGDEYDEGISIKRVDYLVVVGDGEAYWRSISDTNVIVKALSQVITRYYGETRVTAKTYSPSVEAGQVVRSANPTFSWTIDEPQRSGYTAFKIQVADASGATVYDSGMQPAPARDANGRYTWSAPLYVGDKTGKGVVYQNDASYTWKVSMSNAKFATDVFSQPSTYLQATQTNGLEYGTAHVAVKYFGPKDAFAGKTVRVRAFTSPDFTGTPVAAGFVAAPDDDLTGLEACGTEIAENCRVLGLPKGSYYLQAFIDSNDNGVWDSWESMGYLCDRSGASADWLNPLALSFGDKIGPGDLAIIYIEDADTDGDSLPDAWEFAKYGNLTAKGVEQASLTPTAEYVTERGVAQNLKVKAEAAGGLAGEILYTLTSSKSMMALVSGVEPEALQPQVEMKITGLSLNVESGTVDVTLNGTVTSMGEDLSNAVYTYRAGDSVTFQVYHTDTLAGEWSPVGAEQTIKVTTGAVGEMTLSVPVEGLGTKTGGFFKVLVK